MKLNLRFVVVHTSIAVLVYFISPPIAVEATSKQSYWVSYTWLHPVSDGEQPGQYVLGPDGTKYALLRGGQIHPNKASCNQAQKKLLS